jgi:hypothetical protein
MLSPSEMATTFAENSSTPVSRHAASKAHAIQSLARAVGIDHSPLRKPLNPSTDYAVALGFRQIIHRESRDTPMKIPLSREWILTTEHPRVSHGVSVLVLNVTQEAYVPGDNLKHARSWRPTTSVHVVLRLARYPNLTPEQQSLVYLFTGTHDDTS